MPLAKNISQIGQIESCTVKKLLITNTNRSFLILMTSELNSPIPNTEIERAAFLLCIQVVLGSNLSFKTSYAN
jgi:hypothetical protein